ncbi:MAG: 50S ribosomal protein L5, partial [Rhodospirillaceae bacterium]|nr:50S ribosomal protein L5 [Rhodospirillaceae bacterium]
MTARLREHYDATVKPELMQSFSYGNAFEVPRLEKIVVNMGVGEAVADSKKIDSAAA